MIFALFEVYGRAGSVLGPDLETFEPTSYVPVVLDVLATTAGACAKVLSYISGILKPPPGQEFMVSTDCFKRRGEQTRSLAADLKNAGYTRVTLVGLIDGPPPHSC